MRKSATPTGGTCPAPTAPPLEDVSRALYFKEAVIMAALDEVQTAIQCPREAADLLEAGIMALAQYPVILAPRSRIVQAALPAADYRILAAENLIKIALTEGGPTVTDLLPIAADVLAAALEAVQDALQEAETEALNPY